MATRISPRPSTQVAFGATLRERLLAVNLLDVPFLVETNPSTNQLIASWRYVDAKWIDHARAHGMRCLHRIVLDLDEAQKKVRATDFATSYDWSAGAVSAMLNWKFVTGVVFFQYEQQRVFGLQLDEHGRFKPPISYAYTFNLAEMKAPLIAAVTRSGWTWQLVAWQSPR
jgi:hypothetical protein